MGVDEAGRGPLAGPVVSCALYLSDELPLLIYPTKRAKRQQESSISIRSHFENCNIFAGGFRDSKQLSPFLREEAFRWLQDNTVFSVGMATHQEIDRLNILEATFLSFNRAIEGLLKKAPHLKKATFIVDGNSFRTNLAVNYRCVEKADRKIKEVSCASIVAKVTRDHLMNVAHSLFPKWNFFRHKGYPTPEHIWLLEKCKLSPIHRRSFYPCKNVKG
ncbi:MAG: ribonuclease HII [Candidatus Omnitrophota bacterium]|nr:MAG: ribonuclease HII [Candidatus Omnitrophota bacterium]